VEEKEFSIFQREKSTQINIASMLSPPTKLHLSIPGFGYIWNFFRGTILLTIGRR
jgi:hypothetical protein